MSINTIIVDDEKPARDELAYLLKAFPEINVIGQGKNGLEAVALIKEHAPDLVFLDVHPFSGPPNLATRGSGNTRLSQTLLVPACARSLRCCDRPSYRS
jgi:DNA-binding NarL/FixJ family response regulator